MADLTSQLIQRYQQKKQADERQTAENQAAQLRSLTESTGTVNPTNEELGLQFNAGSAPQLFSQGLGNISASLGAAGTRNELQRRQDALTAAESFKRATDAQAANRQYGLDLANAHLAKQQESRLWKVAKATGQRDTLAREKFKWEKDAALADDEKAKYLEQQLGGMEEYAFLGARLDANKKGWGQLLDSGKAYIDDTSGQPKLAEGASPEEKALFEQLQNTAGLEVTGSRLESMAQQLVDISRKDDSPLNDYTLEEAKAAVQGGLNQAITSATQIQPRHSASHEGTLADIQSEVASNQRLATAEALFAEELAGIEGTAKLNPELAEQQRANLLTRVDAATPMVNAYQEAKSKVSSSPNFFGEELKSRVPNTLDEGDIANLTSEANTILGEVSRELANDKELGELKGIFEGMGVTDPAARVAVLNAVLDPQAGEIDYETFKWFGDANFYKDQLKPRIKAELLKSAKMEQLDRKLKAIDVTGQRKTTIANTDNLLRNTGLGVPKKKGGSE